MIDGGDRSLTQQQLLQKVSKKYVSVSGLLLALKECGRSGDLRRGTEIHLEVKQSGLLNSNAYIANSLITMYAKCRNMVEARRVFDSLVHERDLVSWNSLLQGYVDNGQSDLALRLFERMEDGDARTYVAALTACSSLAAVCHHQMTAAKWLLKGQEIHSRAVNRNCCNIYVESALVGLFAKCGSMIQARQIFERMVERNVVSWNALLHGHVENGEYAQAAELFEAMETAARQGGCAPDARSYVAALAACANLATGDEKRSSSRSISWLEKGRMLHSRAVVSRCCNVFVESTLVDMYGKFGCMNEARSVFDGMAWPNVVSWNALIMGYVDNGESELALELISAMDSRGVSKDSLTFVAAIMACGDVMAVKAGEAFHAEIRARKLEQHSVVANCLMDFYGKCGVMEMAKQVFDSLRQKTIVSWTTLMCGYALQGETERVFAAFDEMRKQDVLPNHVTFTCVLTACSHAGLTDKGREYFEAMRSEYGLRPSLKQYACMADLLGRANCVEEAVRMVREMPMEADVVIWKALLSACRKWKNVVLGKVAFDRLMRLDDQDCAGYVLMANIYQQAGMLEQSNKILGAAAAAGPGMMAGKRRLSQTWWSDKAGKVHKFVTAEDQNHISTFLGMPGVTGCRIRDKDS